MNCPVPPRGPLREASLETLRTARVWYLGGGGRGEPAEIWYLLHGYGERADRFLERFRSLASPDRLLVAPEGLSRFYLTRGGKGGHSTGDRVGASWMTRLARDAEIRDYVRYLDLVARQAEEGCPGEEPVRTVLGFSQGVHTAARWVCLGGLRTARLVLWGASLPEDLPDGAARRLAVTRLILVRGREDRLRRRGAEEAEERWLGRAGIEWTVRTHGGGHEIVPSLLQAIAGDAGP